MRSSSSLRVGAYPRVFLGFVIFSSLCCAPRIFSQSTEDDYESESCDCCKDDDEDGTEDEGGSSSPGDGAAGDEGEASKSCGTEPSDGSGGFDNVRIISGD